MWNGAAPNLRVVRPFLIFSLLFSFCSTTLAQEGTPPSKEEQGVNRGELFVALLRRRAERIVESRRAPPPPPWSSYGGISSGTESNVNLDGSRKGDSFFEQSAGILFQPTITRWLSAQLAYDFLGTEFRHFTDSNLWSHAFKALLQVQPHRAVQLETGYEFGLLVFPWDEDSGFFDHRIRAHLSYAQRPWLTHRVGWTYQTREYETRRARDGDQVKLNGMVREDQRHTASYEMRFRWPKTFARLGVEWYQNFSNDHFQDYYDWADVRVRGLLTRPLTPRWMATLSVSQERKNYQARSIPAINVAERDDLFTAAGSLMFQFNPYTVMTTSTTYRHQDSNDPRLDFTDWIHQLGVTISF